MNKAYALKFNNGADFWRVYDRNTGFCISEHNSRNSARKKVKRLNKRIRLEKEKDKMDIQFATKKAIWFREDEPVNYACPPTLFGNCEAATPPLPNKKLCEVRNYETGELVEYTWKNPYPTPVPYGQEKGINPMRIDNTTATAYVTTPKSDDATAREYLLSRLATYESWCSPKLKELSELFKLGEDGRPETYLQLIDAIKNDKFTLDPKAAARLKRLQEELADDPDDMGEDPYGYGPFYGIIFTDFPKADRKGYDAAVKQFEDLTKTTKDIIMVKSPEDGLTALQALEAWTPAGKAN